MSLLRAIFRLFSDLTEATTATANDWLAIQKNGETQVKKIKPTNLPYAATSHTHGNLSSDGKIGTTANLPVITGTGGAVTTGSFGTTANTFCQGNDSRLSDARTPTSHSHTITDLPTTANNPAALGPASPGNATTISRSNHVHPMPSASDVAAMSTSHAANAITGFGSSATALGSSSAGSATTVSRSDHVHSNSVPADLSLTASSDVRILKIGSGRGSSGAGNSSVEFYSANSGNITADIVADGGSQNPLRIRRRDNGGDIRLQAPTTYARNIADNAMGAFECGSIIYDTQTQRSDPRLKRGLRTIGAPPTNVQALKSALVRYNFRHEADDTPAHLGFDAATLRDIFPEISITRPARPDLPEEAGLGDVLSYDVTGLIAALTYAIADLADRVEALEGRR